MSCFSFRPIESLLLGRFRKLFFPYTYSACSISISLFLAICLSTVFSTPGDTSQNLHKVLKHKIDTGGFQEWVQAQEVAVAPTGPHGCITVQVGYWYPLESFLPLSEIGLSQGSTGKLSLTVSQLAQIKLGNPGTLGKFIFLSWYMWCWGTWRRACVAT